MKQQLFLLYFTAAVTSLSLEPRLKSSTAHHRAYRSTQRYTQMKAVRQDDSLPPGFHYIFVDAGGNTSWTRGVPGTKIEVAGSPLTTNAALLAAAHVVAKMTMNMPRNIFTKLAKSASVGVFTAAENLTVYPEFASLASESCGSSCEGSCSQTCTFDGRKFETLAGVGSRRAVILDDNVLCTSRDPYRHNQNILSHEFTHTVHEYGLSNSVKQQIEDAYLTAKTRSTWALKSYAMSNQHEYLAEGASVFFHVNQNNRASGGMSFCGYRLCASEQASRKRLQTMDPALYNILSYIFTDNRPSVLAGLTVCPPISDDQGEMWTKKTRKLTTAEKRGKRRKLNIKREDTKLETIRYDEEWMSHQH